ncbi:MAG: 16S rRNA (cytidine(1402)-2'-O)-methyltransferase [Pseudomonadota bacterium]
MAGQPADGVARSPLPAGLYLVATPIGHARDITLRALDVLRDADGLAAEDTRRTRQLLDIHGIQVGDRPLVSYHDRNGPARRPQILGWLAEGKSIAYASDAGTPLVADPGYRLAEAAREAGHQVTVVPGASAVLAALSVAGLPTDRFYFGGFLPTKTAARRAALTELAGVPGTLVFFESPRRAADALADMSYVLGPERDGALARELTKAFEEVRRGSLADLAEEAAEDPPRGEVVLLAGPRGVEATRADASARLDAVLGAALETLSVKEAARSVATELGLPKREVYARALEMAKVAD